MFKSIKNGISKAKKSILTLSIAAFAVLSTATSAFADNPDLADVTKTLNTGTGDVKTNGIAVINIIIPVIVAIFGIGWLIVLWRKKMSKAS